MLVYYIGGTLMSDVEIYELACWLGDTKTLFEMFEKDKTPELDRKLFDDDLVAHYCDNYHFFYDIGDHVFEIIGHELSFVRNVLN